MARPAPSLSVAPTQAPKGVKPQEMLNSRMQVASPVRKLALKAMTVCILSGIEIPHGKYSIEHYCPKSRMPHELACLAQNKLPAIKVFNSIKGALFPCEWEELKYDLCYRAYLQYNLRTADRILVRQALNGMPHINPCERCVCSCYKQYCIKER